MEVTVTSDDVDNLVRALRTHADAKAFKRDLYRGLSAVARDKVRPKMVDVIDEALPTRGGLSGEIRESIRARISAKGGQYAGVSLFYTAKAHDVRLLTNRRLRHPVFGNRSAWVEQTAGVNPEVFTDRFDQLKPDIARAVNEVLEDIARKVTNI
jgi:hypothetical protein